MSSTQQQTTMQRQIQTQGGETDDLEIYQLELLGTPFFVQYKYKPTDTQLLTEYVYSFYEALATADKLNSINNPDYTTAYVWYNDENKENYYFYDPKSFHFFHETEFAHFQQYFEKERETEKPLSEKKINELERELNELKEERKCSYATKTGYSNAIELEEDGELGYEEESDTDEFRFDLSRFSLEEYGRGYLLYPFEGSELAGTKYFMDGWWMPKHNAWFFKEEFVQGLIDWGLPYELEYDTETESETESDEDEYISETEETESDSDEFRFDLSEFTLEEYGNGYLLYPFEGSELAGTKYFMDGWWMPEKEAWFFKEEFVQGLVDWGLPYELEDENENEDNEEEDNSVLDLSDYTLVEYRRGYLINMESEEKCRYKEGDLKDFRWLDSEQKWFVGRRSVQRLIDENSLPYTLGPDGVYVRTQEKTQNLDLKTVVETETCNLEVIIEELNEKEDMINEYFELKKQEQRKLLEQRRLVEDTLNFEEYEYIEAPTDVVVEANADVVVEDYDDVVVVEDYDDVVAEEEGVHFASVFAKKDRTGLSTKKLHWERSVDELGWWLVPKAQFKHFGKSTYRGGQWDNEEEAWYFTNEGSSAYIEKYGRDAICNMTGVKDDGLYWKKNKDGWMLMLTTRFQGSDLYFNGMLYKYNDWDEVNMGWNFTHDEREKFISLKQH
jgi:hypothetical protein